ncbi:MAG: hypothetical protein R3C14_12280 [Caldilineaceae bacterium]
MSKQSHNDSQHNNDSSSYEVEIRFCVANQAEAFALLPFLEASLGAPKAWSTEIVGRTIYSAGKLLRVGRVPPTGESRYYLGYKGPDLGAFANIRQELGEEITHGITQSEILTTLGLAATHTTTSAIVATLNEAGHRPFMAFAGVDRLGYYPPLALHTKLCQCAMILDDQLLVELELGANSLAAAQQAEARLQSLAADYGLTDRLFREEPPTLLYQRTFG